MYRYLFLFVSIFLFGFGILTAQPDTCVPIIEDALTQLDQTCGGLSRNTACYGNTQVQATFTDAIQDVQFAIPSDKVALNFLAGLRASPYNAEEESWGIAVMNAQANLPGTFPGQGVVMLVMGDTEVTNRVPTDEAFVGLPPIEATVNTQGARIRTGAGLNYNIVSVASNGDTVEIDAQNEVGDWVRVVYNDVTGWIYRDLVALTTAESESLPVIDDTIRTPMQAFYFSSGIGTTECNEAPDAILLQSPRGAQVTLSVNEAEITLGSTVLLETEPNQMVIYVIDGTVTVNNLIIPEGYKAFVPTTDSGQVVQDLNAQGITTVQAQQLPTISGQWNSCTPIENADLSRFAALVSVPSTLLNYPLEAPGTPTQFCASPQELAALQQQAAQAAATSVPQETEEAVVPVSTEEVIAPVGTEETVVVDGYDCAPFRIASPREGMAFGMQTFYWDPTNPGAASYDVFVYDGSGNLVAQTTTSATTTTLDTGDRDPNGGATYSWTVQAKDTAGNVVCGPLERAYQLREAAPVSTPEPESPPEQIEEPDYDTCDYNALEAAADTCEYDAEIDDDNCTYTCLEPIPR